MGVMRILCLTKEMKMKKILLACLMAMVMVSLKAQEEDQTEFSDEELIKYATVMVWAKGEQEALSDNLVNRIKSDSALTGRYNALKKAYGDEDELAEIEATEAEIAAYEEIVSFEDSIKAAFKEEYVGKIKDEITIRLYNDLNKALKNDSDLKARYETIFEELLAAATAEIKEEEGTDAESDS